MEPCLCTLHRDRSKFEDVGFRRSLALDHQTLLPACGAPALGVTDRTARGHKCATRRPGPAEHILLNNRIPIGWFACLLRWRRLHFCSIFQGAGLISFAASLYVCKRFSARISVALNKSFCYSFRLKNCNARENNLQTFEDLHHPMIQILCSLP